MKQRLRTLVHLFGPHQLRAALRLNAASGTTSIAMRCGISMALALLVAGLTGNVQVAGFAALGSLASLYGRMPGRRYRVSVTVLAGLALSATVLIVSVAASQLPFWLVPLIIAVLASTAQWACDALRQGPPGVMMPIFALAPPE